MKKKRVLAFVLCLVMLFSDATSTFASSLSDTGTVITDLPDNVQIINTELTETETTETETTETETTETETTETETTETETTESETTESEVTESETTETETTESETTESETTESETTETEEEILTEKVEQVKTTTPLILEVAYPNEPKGSYESFAKALDSINWYLKNGGVTNEIQIQMIADAVLDVPRLELDDTSVSLKLDLQGHTLTVNQNAIIRAGIWTEPEMLNDELVVGKINVASGKTLSIFANNPSNYGPSTNLHNIVINFTGNENDALIIGETSFGGSFINAEICLNDVRINNVNDVTFSGNVYYGEINNKNTTFNVADTLTINTTYNNSNMYYQNILVSTTCENLVWNGNAAVSDMTVNNTLTSNAGFEMRVKGNLNVKDIVVNASSNEWESFWLRPVTVLDDKNVVLSTGEVNLNGTITVNGNMERAIVFGNEQFIDSTGYGTTLSWTAGQKIAAIGANADIDTSLIGLANTNMSKIFAAVVDDGNGNKVLQAEEVAVEIFQWKDGQNNQSQKTRRYASWEEALTGLENDFNDEEAQYNMFLYKDVTLTSDAEIPDFITRLHIQGGWEYVETQTGGYDVAKFVTMDFNGHSLTLNCNTFWSESVAVKNSKKDSDSKIKLLKEAEEWTPGNDNYEPVFRVNYVEDGTACADTAGNTIDRTADYTWNTGVTIEVPNGRLELSSDEAALKRSIDADVNVKNFKAFGGNWELGDITITQNDQSAYVKEDTTIAFTGTTNVTGGSGMIIRGDVTFGELIVNAAGENDSRTFAITVVTGYNKDKKNALTYQGSVTFDGHITNNGTVEKPISFFRGEAYFWHQKDNNGNLMYEGNGNPWIGEEQHWSLPMNEGDKVATVTKSEEEVSTDLFTANAEGETYIVERSGNDLVIKHPAVSVSYEYHSNNGTEDETDDVHISISKIYSSLESAFKNLEKDFNGREGQYYVTVYGNVTLTEDIEVPECVKFLSMESRWSRIDESEGSPHAVTFVTMDLAGHSIAAHGEIFWSEAIAVKNSKAASADSIISTDAEIRWDNEDTKDINEHYNPTFRVEAIDNSVICMDVNGNAINRATAHRGGYTWNNGVIIKIPDGRFELCGGGAAFTRKIAADVEAGCVAVHGDSWELKNLTMINNNDYSFVGEDAKLVVTGTTKVNAVNGIEVRGELKLGNLVVAANADNWFDSYGVEITTIYDRDNADALLYQGKVTFTGTITKEGDFAMAPIRLEKKHIYRWMQINEETNEPVTDWDGNIQYNEDHRGNQDFASGEQVVTVTNSTVKAEMFRPNNEAFVFLREGNAIKAYQTAIRVFHTDENGQGYGADYRSLEDAFSKMAADFKSSKGEYTIVFVEDVKMSKNLSVPSFVTLLRLETETEWIVHRDKDGDIIYVSDENGNLIYDEEGNPIEEGHNQSDFAKLDLNGFTITSPAPVEVREGLQLVSEKVSSGKPVKGKLVVNATTGEGCDYWNAVSFNQIIDGGLIDSDGKWVERNDGYTWRFVDNVDITASKGRVEFWSLWDNCTYVVNGNITAKEMVVRGNWEAVDATLSQRLDILEGWYDEEKDEGEIEGNLTLEKLNMTGGYAINCGKLFVNNTLTATNNATVENYRLVMAGTVIMSAARLDNWCDFYAKSVTIKDFYNHTDIFEIEDNPETEEIESHVEAGAQFVCDTFTHVNGGELCMDCSSNFIISKKAVIYNLCVDGYNEDTENPVNFMRMPGATIELNGTTTRNNENIKLCMGIFDPPEGADRVAIVEVPAMDEKGNEYTAYCLAFIVEEPTGTSRHGMENSWPVITLPKNEVLFTTNSKTFPTDWICFNQKESDEVEEYWECYQKGNEIRVGGNWIIISTVAEGNMEELKSFSNWDEAANFISALSNPNISYLIRITEDVDIEGNLVFPKKAESVRIVSGDESRITLTYRGDISLTSDLLLGGVNLKAVTASGASYHSNVKLNGYELILENSNANFAAVTGTSKSVFRVYGDTREEAEGTKVTVDKAIKTLESIELFNAALEVGGMNKKVTDTAISGVKNLKTGNAELIVNGTTSITGDTVLYSTTIESEGKINLADVYSLNDKNRITYNGTTAGAITISGSVYGAGDLEDPDGIYDRFYGYDSLLSYEGFSGLTERTGLNQTRYYTVEDFNSHADRIRTAAIDIYLPGIMPTDGTVLLNAAKVSPRWFVVGSEYEDVYHQPGEGEAYTVTERTSVVSMTNKKGNQICCGKVADGTVELFTWNDAVGENGSFLAYNTYATLQEAFTAIDTIGDKNAAYYIELDGNTAMTGSLKTPSKADTVIINSVGVDENGYSLKRAISYKSELVLNCNLILENIELAPVGTNKITLGNYRLSLEGGTGVANGCKINSVNGSGVAKASELAVIGTEITISGAVNNVGTVRLEKGVLYVEGAVNIGDIYGIDDPTLQKGESPALYGAAKITRNTTTGKVTKIEPQITINGDTNYSYEDGEGFYIGLMEKKSDGRYEQIGISSPEMSELREKGVQLAKATKMSSMMVKQALIYDEGAEQQYCVAKENGYLVCQRIDNIGLGLGYVIEVLNEETGEYEEVQVYTPCKTFADAVKEINNLNTKRSYEMWLTPNISEISKAAPAQLTMPNARAIQDLYIYGEPLYGTGIENLYDNNILELYYTGNITLTCDVIIKYVDFVQAAKVDGEYISVNDQKNNYPAAVTVNANGKNLDIFGDVTFNTPVNLKSNGKGALSIGCIDTYTDDSDTEITYAYGSLSTFTNNNLDDNTVCGSITGFADVNLNYSLNLIEYGTVSNGKLSYTAPTLSATNLNILDAFEKVDVDDDDDADAEDVLALQIGSCRGLINNKANLTVTNMELPTGAYVKAEGSATIKNTVLADSTILQADKLTLTNVVLHNKSGIVGYRDFTISGTVTSKGRDAVLYTIQAKTNSTPKLNITGKVELTDPANKIGIAVWDEEWEWNGLVKLENSPKTTGMLLTAKNATADMFTLANVELDEGDCNNAGGKEVYTADNTSGYFLQKSGNSIYVYYGDEIEVSLSKGTGNDTEVIGYYTSFNNAAAEINRLNDKTADYTITLLKDVGSANTAPAALTMPKAANSVTIDGNSKKLYFKSSITLNAPTTFDSVAFCPLTADRKATTFDISTGVHDLTLKGVTVGDGAAGHEKMALRNINGNKNQDTILKSAGLVIAGNVTNSNDIEIWKKTEITGNVTGARKLYIRNNNDTDKNVIIKGNVTSVELLEIGLRSAENAKIAGNANVKKLTFYSGCALTVGGTLTVTELAFDGSNKLYAQNNAVTITDISNNAGESSSANTIFYGKDKNGAPNLTIKGTVSGTATKPVVLQYTAADLNKADYVLKADNVKYYNYTLNNKYKVATIEKAPLSAFDFKFATAVDDANLVELEDRETVKANKGVYVIDIDSPADYNGVLLEMTKETESGTLTGTTYCLDFSQAVNEINTIADPDAEYVIRTGIRNSGLEDTNLTDKKAYSPLTLPGANKAKSLTITSDNNSEIIFTGNISYSGDLTLRNLELNPRTSATVAFDFNISVTKDKAGNAQLDLINVTTTANKTWQDGNPEVKGFINQISGTKNATNVSISDSDLRLKSGIINVDTLTLSNAPLITCGTTSNVNNVVIDDSIGTTTTWDALTTTTVGNITVEQWNTAEGYISSRQTANAAKTPMFKVTGNVNLEGGIEAIPVKVLATTTKNNDIVYLEELLTGNTYKDVSLVIAQTANADNFIAYPFADADNANDEGLTNSNRIAYKDTTNAVKNGNKSDMQVKLIYTGGFTYAKSYAEAVTLINNINNKNGVYEINFLNTGDVVANGKSYSALTFPTKAAEVTISGAVENGVPAMTLKYTGTIKPSVKVTFEDIILTEGTVSRTGVFTPTYAVTVDVSNAAATITFEATASTLKKDNTQTADLVFTEIKGGRGNVIVKGTSDTNGSYIRTVDVKGGISANTLRLEKVKNNDSGKRMVMNVVKDISVTTLEMSEVSAIYGSGKFTAKNVMVLNSESVSTHALVDADKLITITNVNSAEDSGDSLRIHTNFTTTTRANQVSESQLKINGKITDTVVGIETELYDFNTTSYVPMTAERAEALLITDENKAPAKGQKIADLPVDSGMNVVVYVKPDDSILWDEYAGIYEEDAVATPIKHVGGLYLTTLPPLLAVSGAIPIYREDGSIEDRNWVYGAYFLTWEEAVKEIDKMNDKEVEYSIELLRNVGQKLNGELAPIANLTLPTKASCVEISSWEDKQIFFTGTTITAKCDTMIGNVGLMAVKKVTKNRQTWYESTKYNLNIGNYGWMMGDMLPYVDVEKVVFESLPGTVSGSRNGYFSFCTSDEEYSNMPATKITGVGTVQFYSNMNEDELVRIMVPMGITGVNDLVVDAGVCLLSGDGAISVKNLLVDDAVVFGKNVTVTGTTDLTSAAVVAGTETIGDGTLKLTNVVLQNRDSILSAKQDRNGKSLMQITGTIAKGEEFGEETSIDEALTIELRYNNDSGLAQLYNGMLLLTAPKAEASWFVPYYTTNEDTGMGRRNDDYCVYKVKNAMYYGYSAQ